MRHRHRRLMAKLSGKPGLRDAAQHGEANNLVLR